MRRFILIAALVMGFVATATAQNYAVVDSEKIFKSIDAYNQALEQLDELAEKYQAEVDAKFEKVENLYNAYMQRKATLSQSAQKANEDNIIKLEEEATKFQESIFGTDGELMKKRLELIQPIQKKVFTAIEEYAKQKGYDMIIDVAQNATMLYYAPKADKTTELIAILKAEGAE